MDSIVAAKKKYNILLGVCAAVYITGAIVCSVFPTEWGFVLLPLLGCAGVGALWALLARLCFCKDPTRRLQRSFTRPVFRALCAPAWLLTTWLLFVLPSDGSAWNDDLATALALLVTLALLAAVPVAALWLAISAVVAGWRHVKQTPEGETRVYREGPFALAVIWLCLLVAGATFGIVYFFIS